MPLPLPLREQLRELAYLGMQRGMRAAVRPFWQLWHQLLGAGSPSAAWSAEPIFERRFEALLARDLENVRRGAYPASLLFDFPFARYLGTVPEALLDMASLVRRRRRREVGELPAGIDLERYPPYYRRNFHWQTDGWLSARSARLYDGGVEFLFGGAADVMRRMVIPYLVQGCERLRLRAPRILDVACGTGRLLRQLHVAMPQAQLLGLDLSPYYVAHARAELADIPPLSLLVCPAERMLLRDESVDAVTSIFLFHELPGPTRSEVLAEMYRVLRPGGRLVLCDSVQAGDAGTEDISSSLRWFPAMYHEPFYEDYARDSLERRVRAAGFGVEQTEWLYLSKFVVAQKPVTPVRRRLPSPGATRRDANVMATPPM